MKVALMSALLVAVFAEPASSKNRDWEDAGFAKMRNWEAPLGQLALRLNPPPVKDGQRFYFVAQGDTYHRIARLSGVDARALRALNNNVELRPGLILRLPNPAPKEARRPARVRRDQEFYFVAVGETYESIARLKGVEVGALRAFNDNVILQAGRILRIPPPAHR